MQELVQHSEKIINNYFTKLNKDNEYVLENFKYIRELVLGWMDIDSSDMNCMIVTGSRCPNHMFAYNESDIDVAFVGETMEKLYEYESALKKATEKFPKEWTWKSVRTKAGLPWFPINNVKIGDKVTKLDITFRLSSIHNKIETLMTERSEQLFNTNEKHIVQIIVVREAYLEHMAQQQLLNQMDPSDEKYSVQKDLVNQKEQEYLNLKKWCRDLALA